MSGIAPMGSFQMACEISPNKQQIDIWLNEGRSSMWISRELKAKHNESISDKGITKYRKKREEMLQESLMQDPTYQNKMNFINQQLIDGVGRIKEVNIIDKLADTIEHCSDLLNDARDNDIQIRNAQDIRFIQMSLLDAIKVYGDTVLKMQKYTEIKNDPTLLKPTTINVNVKSALTDILKEVMQNGGNGFSLIDQLRTGIRSDVYGGNTGDIGDNRSGDMDGNIQDVEGTTILVQE